MALTKKTAAAPAAGAPGGFEEEDNTAGGAATATVEKETAAQTVASAAKVVDSVAAAGVEATKAIAKAGATAVSVAGAFKGVVAILEDIKDAMPRVEFGTLPRIVGANGGILNKEDNVTHGEWLNVEVVSFNDEFVVSPGDDSDEAKALVRYSADGKTIDETGESVQEYLDRLRTAEGFTKASVKHYTQVIGIALAAAKNPEAVVGDMVQISLSPQGRKKFDGYRIQEAVKVRMGQRKQEGLATLRFTAAGKSGGGKNWTELHAGAVPA